MKNISTNWHSTRSKLPAGSSRLRFYQRTARRTSTPKSYNLLMIPGAPSKMLAAAAAAGSCLLGAVLLTIAWQDYQARTQFLERAWPTRAEIVALEPASSDLSRSNPIASFTTIRGVPVRVALPGLNLSPGDTINLLYDAELPEVVRVYDAWAMWFEPCAFGGAGALLTIVPLLALIDGRRRRPATP